MTKKNFYIIAFTFLGVLFGFLVQSWIALVYANRQILNFDNNHILFFVLAFGFGVLGLWAGEYWWKQIYVLNKFRKSHMTAKKIVFNIFIFCLLLIAFALYYNSRNQIQSTNPTLMQMTSPSFAQNQPIPKQFTCQGAGISPELDFAHVPSTAQSLALVLHDPDAPIAGGFTHWVVFNMPTNTMKIAENAKPPGTEAKNGAGKNSYMGPCPPSGTHHYHFALYALDTKLDSTKVTDRQSFLNAAKGHIVEQTELVGLFSK